MTETATPGTYTRSYTVAAGDDVKDATVRGYLQDAAGNVESLAAIEKVTIDTGPPVFSSLTIQPEIAKAGDNLTITFVSRSASVRIKSPWMSSN